MGTSHLSRRNKRRDPDDVVRGKQKNARPAEYSRNVGGVFQSSHRTMPYRAATCDTVFGAVRSLALYATMPAKAAITTTAAANTQPVVSICALHSGLLASRRSVIETSHAVTTPKRRSVKSTKTVPKLQRLSRCEGRGADTDQGRKEATWGGH